PPRDRRAARESEARHRPRRSRSRRDDGRARGAGSPRGPLRDAGLHQGGGAPATGQQRGRREGGADAGRDGGGGRRRRLHHRRDRGWRPGRGGEHPGGAQRDRQLSDRDLEVGAERRGRAGVRRLRPVRGRAARAAALRVHRAVRPRREGVPPVAAVVAALGASLFILPLVGLLWRAPWMDLGQVLLAPEALTAMRLSLVCSLAATALSMVLRPPLASVPARGPFPRRALLRALPLLPVALPPVVGGVALLAVFGRRGLIGQWLHPLGIQLPFTTAGAILAETFVAMPFFVLAMEGVLRGLDRRLEDAARTLG